MTRLVLAALAVVGAFVLGRSIGLGWGGPAPDLDDIDWLAEYDPARAVRWPYGGTVS